MRHIFLILCTIFSVNATNINIAVQDLVGQNMDSVTIDILSKRLRSELVENSTYTVVERAQMESILEEQGFQQTGVCEESSCLVEIGRILGVHQIVAGSIGKLSEHLYTVSLRVIDVESSEIIQSATYDHAGSLDRLLTDGITIAVGKLLENSMKNNEKKYLGEIGDIYITSVPSGASIEINGNKRLEKTPVLLEGFPAGAHEIVVKHGDRRGRKNILLEPNNLLKLKIDTYIERPTIKIITEPLGVQVSIDKKHIGETPLQVDTLSEGKYTLGLYGKGLKPVYKDIYLKSSERTVISESMLPAAHLMIRSKPSGATLFINEIKQGVTPWMDSSFAIGEHAICLEIPEHQALLDTIVLTQGDKKNKQYSLELKKDVVLQKKKRSKLVRRILFGTFATTALTVGLIENNKVEKYKQSYQDYKGYSAEQHDINWNSIKDAQEKRDLSYILTGIFGIGFAVSIPF